MEDGEEDMSTLHYDVACGPQQLAKYLADMRMLVLNLEEADGEDEGGECRLGCVRGASSPSAATRIGCLQCTQFSHHMLASWSFLGAVRTLGYAYIHLSLAPFGAPFLPRPDPAPPVYGNPGSKPMGMPIFHTQGAARLISFSGPMA